MGVVVVFTIIGIIVFYGALKIVINNDKTSNLQIKKEIKITLIILISTTLIYLKYKLTIDFLFIFYLSIYLIICGYIDKKTMYIYSLFNYITIIISIIYLIVKIEPIYVTNIIINVIIYMVFSVIMTRFNIYGGGDNEIFIAISLYIAVNSHIFPLEALLINVILSNVVMTILNFKKFNFRKMKLNSRIAYAPSIAISTMILLLI
jgi:hypothetical protein